jgi:hypothetical protein
MAIFNRKNKNKDSHDEPEPTQKEKVKFSKRPASMSSVITARERLRNVLTVQILRSSSSD